MIKWGATKEETETIAKIAKRAVKMSGVDNQMDVVMDIEATHCNGNPLKLAELLTADDVNFAHDVFGIRVHLDRTTGNPLNCFVPCYSS